MIITDTKREIQTEGLGELKQMRLVQNEEVEAHIVKTLTENYRFPYPSSIREAISNHLDSHVENGNPEHPILVKLYKNSVGDYVYESEDQGLGLNLEEFDKYYMGIGQSSKRGKAELLGAKGLGAKAWLSAVDSYTVITRKNGKEWQFLVFKGEKFPDRAIIEEKDTDLPNGVIIKVNIPYWDRRDVEQAIKEQTCYFKTCFYQIENEPELNNKKIFENDLFTFSEIYPNSEMHISFGPCHYEIEWKSLGISPIYVPVGLKIPIDSGIDVHFNRESLVYDSLCKELIKDKIKQVSEWFVNKYNEGFTEFDSLKKAWSSIDEHYKKVTILDKSFTINDLEQYSSVKFNNIKIKGIEHIPAKRFKSNLNWLLKEYDIVGEVKHNGSFKIKNASSYKNNLLAHPTLLIHREAKLVGWFKDFLKTKNYKYFVKKDVWTKPEDLKFYKQILCLGDYPKQDWRKIIQEWQRVKQEFIKEVIIDGTDLHNSKEFIEFRTVNKKNVKYTSARNYKTLNKQKGDITIHYVVPKINNWHEYKFEKKTFKIEHLHREPYKFVVFTEEQKELCKEYHKNLKKFKNYKFVVVSKGEIKRLPNIKSIKMFVKIEQKPSDLKLFQKIATAAMYHKELEKFNTITSNIENTVIESFSNDLQGSIKKLETYVREYKGSYGEVEVLIAKALETNDIDLTLQAEFQQLKEFNEKFRFMEFLKCNRYNKKEFIKELNLQLLMRKLHKPEQFENFQICITEPKKEEVLVEEEI